MNKVGRSVASDADVVTKLARTHTNNQTGKDERLWCIPTIEADQTEKGEREREKAFFCIFLYMIKMVLRCVQHYWFLSFDDKLLLSRHKKHDHLKACLRIYV